MDLPVFRRILFPDFSNGLSIPSLAPVFFKFDFSNILSLNFVVVVFSFLFVDVFDTLGTLIGVSAKAGMLDENGRLPRIKGALMADAVATTAGAVLGTTTVSTYVESATGVSEGGRTGLTSLTTAVLFILSLWTTIYYHIMLYMSILCDSTSIDHCRLLYAD